MTSLVEYLPGLWAVTGWLAVLGVLVHAGLTWQNRRLVGAAVTSDDPWIRAVAWERFGSDPVRVIVKVLLAAYAFFRHTIMTERAFLGRIWDSQDVMAWAIFTAAVVVLSVWSAALILGRRGA